MGEMTKGKTKPKGHKSQATQPQPTTAPNARARETDWGSAMELWLALIGNGETERHAASSWRWTSLESHATYCGPVPTPTLAGGAKGWPPLTGARWPTLSACSARSPRGPGHPRRS